MFYKVQAILFFKINQFLIECNKGRVALGPRSPVKSTTNNHIYIITNPKQVCQAYRNQFILLE